METNCQSEKFSGSLPLEHCRLTGSAFCGSFFTVRYVRGGAVRDICKPIVTLLCFLAGATASRAYEDAPVCDIFYEDTIILDQNGRFTVEGAIEKAEALSGQARRRVSAGGNVYWLERVPDSDTGMT
jgi:hypothetical protein